MSITCVGFHTKTMLATKTGNFEKLVGCKKILLGPISLTDLSLFWGLNPTQSDGWQGLSFFVKLGPGSH